MTRRGLGQCVIVLRIWKKDTPGAETREPAVQLTGPAREVVRAELIDCDENDEPGSRRLSCARLCRCRLCNAQEQSKSQQRRAP